MSVAERGLGIDRKIIPATRMDPKIQPFAAVIAVTTDWVITHISANIVEFLDIDASVLGHTLDHVLLEDAVHEIRGVLNATAGHGGAGRLLGCDLRHGYPQFDLTIHENETGYVIELEQGEQLSKMDDIGLLRGLMARVKQASTPEETADKAARSIRALTGFDRVSVCRVLDDERGKVVSEARLPGIRTLLGNEIAAEYVADMGNVLNAHAQQQIVADVDATPAVLMSGPDHAPLDLTHAISLAPTPRSLAFLRMHAARAALSLPIINDGGLIGLVVCHHAKPLRAGFRTRMLVELFVDLFAHEFAKAATTP
ncbi:MAG: GAF domain-containing protein [Silicimonas sp.]|nr:GAF domain-containing protein [Silicimonas sp.]